MTAEISDKSLRYFLSIAELGSLSKAADVLDHTQSGLSKHLAALESSLGQTLFVRTGRGVELTPAGKKLYDSLRPAYQNIDQAIADLRQQVVTHGTVCLATVHTLSYYFAADVIARFVSTRPYANLSLLGRSSPDVVALVDSGKADIGFVYDVAVDTASVSSEKLFEDDMLLIVRHDDPVATSGRILKSDFRLVGFPPHYALRRMLHSAGIDATYVAEVDTVDAMLKLVSSGMGNCILPSRIPDKLLADYGLRKVPLVKRALRRQLVAITQANRPLPPLVAEFLRCAKQVARELRGDRME